MGESGKDRGLSAKDHRTEREVSEKRTYVFNQKQFDRQTREEIRSIKDHARRNPKGWSSERLADDIKRIKENRARLEAWFKKFSGKIPESWAHAWYNIVQDLENSKIQISDVQVFAAIEYPHWQVQQALGMNRPLNSLQLNALALTHYHSIFTFEEVLTKQVDDLGAYYRGMKTARGIFLAIDDVMIEKAKLGIPVPQEIIV